MDDLFRFKAWVSVLKDVQEQYSGLVIDNIISQLSARIKEIEKQQSKR